jgi:PTS system galactitol-specific IIA component
LLVLSENLIALDFKAADSRTVIDALAGLLVEQGLVTLDYAEQTYKRELNHPTGLPTKPFCIAFPHAGAEGVCQSALAMASLRSPVMFKNMADPDENLPVLLVFMLANRQPEEQIQTLRSLAVLFGQPEKLESLRQQITPSAASDWLIHELHLDGQDSKRGQ